MPDLRLQFGPYTTPRYEYGAVVRDEIRGEVVIVGTSSGQIPWPVFQNARRRSLVIFDDLARAVRVESNQAVAHWWGVTPQTVTVWRKALGVGPVNQGTRRLRVDSYQHNSAKRHAALLPALSRPERRAKIAAAKRGKPRPRRVIDALREANLGKKLDAATRAKMSLAHKRRGTRPPAAGLPWSAAEDELLASYSDQEVARRTGRSPKAAYLRRRQLRLMGLHRAE